MGGTRNCDGDLKDAARDPKDGGGDARNASDFLSDADSDARDGPVTAREDPTPQRNLPGGGSEGHDEASEQARPGLAGRSRPIVNGQAAETGSVVEFRAPMKDTIANKITSFGNTLAVVDLPEFTAVWSGKMRVTA